MKSKLRQEYEERKERNIHLRKLLTGEIQGPLTGKPGVDKPWLLEYPEELLENMPFVEESVFRFLYDSNKDHLDDEVIDFVNIHITNRELIENIISVASALKKMGVKEGDYVSVCLPNTPESAYLLYACSILGAVADYIDPIATETGLEDYLNISNPKYLITMDEVMNKFKNLVNKKNIEKVVCVSPVESLIKVADDGVEKYDKAFREDNREFIENTSADVMTYEKFIKEGRGAYTLKEMEVEYMPDRPVVVVHSGGSTGVPKGVLMSNDRLNSFAIQIMSSNLGYRRENKLLSLMPEFVGYGLSLGLHVARIAGMRTVMIPEYIPEKIAELVLAHKPNVVTASPAHFELFSESKLIDENVDLSGLESFIVGGSTIHPTVELRGNEMFLSHGSKYKVRKGYGFTENNCAVTMCINNEVNELGGSGIPLPFTDVTIYDSENDKDLGYGELGDICVTSPDLMLEYLNNPEENSKAFRKHPDGKIWFHPEDVGYISASGRLKCTDRKKDLIILYNGQKVYPGDVEKILSECPGVRYISVVGVQDNEHYNGQVPVAFVIFEDGIDEKEGIFNLDNYALDKVISYSVPKMYFPVDSFPKTKTGKVHKNSLKAMVHLDDKTKRYTLLPKE